MGKKFKLQKPWVPFICSGVCKNCLGTQLKKQALTISHCKKNAKNPFPLSTMHFLFKIRLTSNQVLCLYLLNIGFIFSLGKQFQRKIYPEKSIELKCGIALLPHIKMPPAFILYVQTRLICSSKNCKKVTQIHERKNEGTLLY